jgi:hypothetical protein
MKHSISYRLAIFCVFLLGLASAVLGQEAAIVGSIVDPAGAFMPGVQITITNTGTGQSWNLSSNEAGQFVAPNLRIGEYTIKAESPGFKTWQQTGLVLNVADRARIDIRMQLGETKDSVTIQSEALRVQADSSEISNVVTGSQLEDLSVNGRNFVTLAALTPGTSTAMPNDFNTPTPVGSNFNLSFNGQNPDHNVWLADGGENYDRGAGGKSSIMPSMEAVAEFRSLTSNYSAEYGLGSGGTMALVFKSGTRDFHGSLWEFARNNALDANNYFLNAAGQPNPPFHVNMFGFNASGPVVLPRYNKARDKTFFFYNMEWRTIRQAANVNVVDAPDAWRTGDFSSLGTPVLVPTNVSSTLTSRFAQFGFTPGQPFPGNRIPEGLLDSNALAFLASGALPQANFVDSDGISRYVGGGSTPTDVREELVRIDHRFNDRFSVFGHFVHEKVAQNFGTSIWSPDSYPTVGTQFGNPSYSAVIRATYAISPALVNEASFNYNGNRIHIQPTGTFARTGDFDVPQFFPSNTLNRFPTINWQKEMGTAWDSSWQPWQNAADDYQVRDDVSWVRGRHNFKAGGQFMLYSKTQEIFGNTQGNFTFNGNFTGSSFADFMLGYASGYQELAVQDIRTWRAQSYSLYLMDTWRITDRLTLNAGVRWEGLPHAYEVQNRMANFYPQYFDPSQVPTYLADGSMDPNGPGFRTVPGTTMPDVPFYMNGLRIAGDGVPSGLVKSSWRNWAPRVGMAYDVTGGGKTVIRVGYGRMYERVQGNDVYGMGPNSPFSYNPAVNNVLFSDPRTSVVTGLTSPAPFNPANLFTMAYSDYKSPASNQWSAGIQHELWSKAVLEVAYVGNANDHQSIYRDLNAPLLSDSRRASVAANQLGVNLIRPYAGWAQIQQAQNSENSHYNSLQANLRVQAAKGLTLQVAYTLSRAINQVAGAPGGGDLTIASNPYDLSYDTGLSQYDRTHIAIINYVYELPFFNKAASKTVRTLLGGWQISGITTFQSGLALTPAYDASGLGMGGLTANRPDLTGSISYPKTQAMWFNPASFTAPAPLQFGSAGKGVIRGPGRNNFNMSVFKSFKGIPWIGNEEGAELQFRLETFNTFNHTQWNAVSLNRSASGFGSVTSTFDPRTLQLGLKLAF